MDFKTDSRLRPEAARCPKTTWSSMAFSLNPVKGEDLWVNMWMWHPTIELLVRAGIFTAERAEPLHFSCGGDVTEAETVKISEFLDTYLPSMTPGERLLINGETTTEPDTFEMFRGQDWDKNYSVTLEWLQKFSSFCRSCGGFCVL